MSARDRYCEYRAACGRVNADRLAGRAPDVDLSEVDRRFEDVVSGDLIGAAREDVEAATFEDGRARHRAFCHLLEDAFVAGQLRGIDRELAARVGGALTRVGKREAPVSAWSAQLGEVSDATTRGEMQRGIERTLGDARGLFEERFGVEATTLESLEYGDRRAWGEARRGGVVFADWETRAKALLAESEARFCDALAVELRAIDVSGRGHSADAERLERLAAFDRDFPDERLGGAFDLTVEAWRIRAGSLRGVHVDDELRPGRVPGAHVVAAEIPGEVHVLLGRGRGVRDWGDYFGALGHATSLSFCSPELPVESRFGSDAALGHAWDALFSRWLRDPAWLEDFGIGPRSERYAAAASLVHALRVRRAAGAVCFSAHYVSLEAQADPRFLGDAFAEISSDATGLAHGGNGALVATGGFAAVDLLRGEALAAQLVDVFRSRGGRRYWRDRGVGELLKEVWQTGSAYSAERIAEELGGSELSLDALVYELTRMTE